MTRCTRSGRTALVLGAAASVVVALLQLVLLAPVARAAAPSVGDVFVADTGNNRVVRVDAGGTQTAVGSGFSGPRGVAVDPAGNVYVADSGNDRVVEVPADGGPQVTVGTGFDDPRSIAIQGGFVYVVDYGHDRVVRMNPDGSDITLVTQHWVDGPVMTVAVGPDANSEWIWVGLEKTNGSLNPVAIIRVNVYDLSVVQYDTGVRKPGAGLAVAPNGQRYQSSVDSAQIVRAETTPLGSGTDMVNPQGLALSALGDVVVADNGNNRVVRYAAGTGTQTVVATGFSGPTAVAVYAPPPTFTAANPPNLLAGVPYSYTFAATAVPGTGAPVFQRMGSGAMPIGFSIDPSTGTLSGTSPGGPVLQGGGGYGYNFIVAVGNAATYTSEFMHLSERAVQFTAASPPDTAKVGVPYSYTFHADGAAPVTYSATSVFEGQPPFPPGVTLDPDTGTLSGTPTQEGTYQYLITASNAFGHYGVLLSPLKVSPPNGAPVVAVTTPNEGASFAAGAVPNASFSCSAGLQAQLKPGTAGCSISVDGAAAAASGTALAGSPGLHTAVVTATQTDEQQTTVTRHYSVSGAGPVITFGNPLSFFYYMNSVPNAEFACTAGTGSQLKAGLAGCSMSVDGAPPIASGSPVPKTVGPHTAVVTLTQTDDQQVTQSQTYNIIAPRTPNVSVTTPADGAAYTQDHVPVAAFACEPTGIVVTRCTMSVDGGSDLGSGTALPAALGSHTVVVTGESQDGGVATVTHTYKVTGGAPTVTVTSPTPGATYAVGAVPAAAFSCTAGVAATLKVGLAGCSASVDGGDALGTGAALPGSVGSHTVEVTARQGDGQTATVSRTYTVTVPAPPGPAALGLRVTPGKAATRAGRTATFKVAVANTGASAAAGVQVCVTVPKSAKAAVKKSSCTTVGALAAGQTQQVRFKLRTKATAGGSYKLVFSGSATGIPAVQAKGKLKVTGARR